MSSDHPVRGPLDPTVVPRFAGPATFARLPRLDEVVVERIRERVADAPIYVSVDIDVLDPAFAPHVVYDLLGVLAPRAG